MKSPPQPLPPHAYIQSRTPLIGDWPELIGSVSILLRPAGGAPLQYFAKNSGGGMGKRIVIDPITRIEGHLRIDVEVDGGTVRDAWASGTMWRGIETILKGRDARDGWIYSQRFCGVCTTVHAIASVRAVENALELEVPLNAQYIRNLILIAHALGDHMIHFYHLSALDWVDVVSALKADPRAASQLA